MNKKDIKNDIKKIIKIKKPNLSDNSLNTYAQLLYTLFYKFNSLDKSFNIDEFENQPNTLKALLNYEPKSRKTTLAALISITKNNKMYKQLMLKDIEYMKNKIDKNERSEAQEINRITTDEIKKIYKKLLLKNDYILNDLNTDDLNIKEFQQFQDLIIVALVSGLYIPPRRALDYTEFKIKNINDKNDNFLKDDTLIFNKYKTKKYYGQQSIKIKGELLKLLNKYIDINPYEYLLVNNKGDKLNEITLNQKIKNIFGKGGVNVLRSEYITELYKNIPDLKTISEQMGHSIETAMTHYIKK
jgi:integrase